MAEHFKNPKDPEHAAHQAEAQHDKSHSKPRTAGRILPARHDDDPVEQHPKSPRREQ
jgi:hypothetical protein